MPRRTWAPNVTLTDPEVGGPVGRLPLGPIRVSGGSPGGGQLLGVGRAGRGPSSEGV